MPLSDIINAMPEQNMVQRIFKNNRTIFFALFICVATAYAYILNSPFRIMDDGVAITDNQVLRDISNFPKLFQGAFFKSNDYYRPLVTTTYMIEYNLFGLNPFFYYLDQILLHSLNSLMVFLAASLLLKNRWNALATAFIFALHPIHWEAIANISGRAILLSAFFVLAGFTLFLRYWEEKKAWLLGGSAACYALALLSKESGGTLLLLILLYLFIFERATIKGSPKKTMALAPFFLIAGAYFLLKSQLNIVQTIPWSSAQELFLGVSTFLKGLWTYIRLLSWPEGFFFDRSAGLFTSATDPLLWAYWLIYAAAGIWLWRCRIKVPPVFFFCLFWFLIELLPVSQILFALLIQPGRISLADHFVYLASIPFIITIVLLGRLAYQQLLRYPFLSGTSLRMIGVCIFIFFSLMTFRQAVFASNEFVMLRDSMIKDPQNARLQSALGLFFMKIGKPLAAEKYLREAIRLDPGCVRYQLGLSLCLFQQNKPHASLHVFKTIRPTRAYEKDLLNNFKNVLLLTVIEEQKKRLPKKPL